MTKNVASIANFEKNMSRLEDIVATLDGGLSSLEETVKLFEQGRQLVTICQQALIEAEQRINVVFEDGTKLTSKPLADIDHN